MLPEGITNVTANRREFLGNREEFLRWGFRGRRRNGLGIVWVPFTEFEDGGCTESCFRDFRFRV